MSDPAYAFRNRVQPLKNENKYPGKKPTSIGVSEREPGAKPDLAGCGKAPNCFSSAAATDDTLHYLQPWRFSKGGSAKAFQDLESAVRAYKPGQRSIDGGGFDVKEADAERGYLYSQFESLKKGYIDDVEFLVRADPTGDGGEVRIRSSSRQGFKDFGVNAKRLNGIIDQLSAFEGWSAPLLTNDRFPEYVKFNSVEDESKNPIKDMSLMSVFSRVTS